MYYSSVSNPENIRKTYYYYFNFISAECQVFARISVKFMIFGGNSVRTPHHFQSYRAIFAKNTCFFTFHMI